MSKTNYLAGQSILCQLLSYIPNELVEQSVSEHQSDRYYKTMTTYKQLVFIFYGVVMGIDAERIFLFDSSTITLFVDIFKGAGRNTINGRKKGGLKIHTKIPMMGFVPDLVHITEAACSDKSFLDSSEGIKTQI